MNDPTMVKANGDSIQIQLAEWEGRGKTIFCIHGLTANCRCFDVIASVIAPKHRVLAMDLRGRGLSDKPETGYSLEHHCRDIEEVLKDLKIEKPVLMGQSLGAYIALAFAHRLPELVDSLILMDAGAQLSIEQWTRVGEAIRPSLERLDKTFPTFEDYVSNLKDAAYLNPWNESIENFFRYESQGVDGVFKSRINPAHIQEESMNLATTDTSGYYQNIKCPVLVLRAGKGMVSDDDLVFPEEVIPAFRKSLPQAEIVSLANINHYSILFQPCEERDRAILRFLD